MPLVREIMDKRAELSLPRNDSVRQPLTTVTAGELISAPCHNYVGQGSRFSGRREQGYGRQSGRKCHS